jgi:hypothetical protein
VLALREYILTDLERKMLEAYLTSNRKTRDFTVLLFRMRKSVERLQADMKLVINVIDREK